MKVRLVAAGVLMLSLVTGCSSGDGKNASDASSSTSVPPKAKRALVIAHRGASDFAPEHTFASYDLAIKQGADYIEQDLQLTADGALVVLHDDTLDRTARGPATSCTGRVAEKTLAQIRECDVGSWFNEAHPEKANPAYVGLRIPTMEQLIDRYGTHARYYIELKALDPGSGMAEALLELLAKKGLLEQNREAPPVLVQSFGADVLRLVHAQRPELPLVQLIPDTGSPVDMTWLDNASRLRRRGRPTEPVRRSGAGHRGPRPMPRSARLHRERLGRDGPAPASRSRRHVHQRAQAAPHRARKRAVASRSLRAGGAVGRLAAPGVR